jgi:Short C-terminal domain
MGAPSAPSTPQADDPALSRVLEPLRSLLIPGEQLEAYAVQRRIFALTHRRVAIGSTTGRLISTARGLFGGFAADDVRWQDLQDADIRVGILGATLSVTAFITRDLASAEGAQRTLVFTGLRKSEAQAVYRLCQAQAQSWREKRRMRDLDELRAKSGGIQLGQAAAASAGGDAERSPSARLERARDMLQKGLITDAEFEQIKAKIVAEL